jgi:amidase
LAGIADDIDATGLAELVASGAVSAAELLEAAIVRTDASAARLNAVPIRFDDAARLQIAACAGRPEGPFGGVPFLLKDIGQDYAGQRFTAGAAVFRDRRATRHSAYTRRCLEAGLVIFGRTATPELGLKGVTESKLWGPSRNPWDTSRTPGGSSGGAAASVAGGLVPMAGANDGGGSIRIPASFCGLFGLKPGTGRISWGPQAGQVWEGASTNGVLTRSVRDCARMLDVLCHPEPGDPFVPAPPSRPYAAETAIPPGRLRIGFSTESPLGTKVDPACIAAVQQAARLLEDLGHTVEPAAPDLDGAALAACYLKLYLGQVAAEIAASGAADRDFEPETGLLAMLGRALPAGDYVGAHLQWHGFAVALANFHASYDLWLLPSVAAPPAMIGELDPKAGQRALMAAVRGLHAGRLMLRLGLLDRLARESLARTPFTQISNLTFTPSMSVPLHRAPAAPGGPALPVGVQFVAPHGGEPMLIRLAAQLEQAAPWPLIAPPPG